MDKKKPLYIILIIGITALLAMSLVINGVHSMKEIFVCQNALENSYYLMQIICAFVVIIGGMVGVRQYVLAKRAESNRYQNSRIQKAIDLSEYYKDNILCNITFIYHVYQESKILDILNNVKRSDMKDFDAHELDKNFSKNQKEEIAKIIESEKFIETIIKWSEIYSTDLISSVYIKNGEKVIEAKRVNQTKVIDYFMNHIICETLNNMEYFSMHFNYETADEKVVYQSLHRTYLDVVHMLYYDISTNNKTGEQKLFTNVIDLFNKWKAKSDMQSGIESSVSRNNIMKGPKAKTV